MGGSDFFVRFWGVRGSIASPSPNMMRYGGNTSTLEVRCGEHLFMFDCGTGARYLGQQLAAAAPLDLDIFLTHTHYDHIGGIPFFGPFFDRRNTCRVHAGHLQPESSIKVVLSELMKAPLFPVPPDVFMAHISFHDFRAGDTLQPRPGVQVRTAPLNHPDRATGYRIEFDGRSICYISDTEHFSDGPDKTIVRLIEGAEIVVYDGMYTEDEYLAHRGWGHSTWNAGVALCNAAGVKNLVVFHHNPDHDDAAMDAIARDLAAARPGSVVAREGMVLRP